MQRINKTRIKYRVLDIDCEAKQQDAQDRRDPELYGDPADCKRAKKY